MTDDALDMMRREASKKVRKRPVYREDRLQINCRYWFDLQYPEYALLLHHSPNEGLLTHKQTDGAKRKAMGVRAGFPDLILLIPRHGYPYLCIELKAGKNRQSQAQKEYQKLVELQGGKYVIINNIESFVKLINEYLNDEE